MTTDVLARFHPLVAEWFNDVFAAPTPVQAAAWESISAGHHALVVAPTGSGKTLSAFLWAINQLVEGAEGGVDTRKAEEPPLAGMPAAANDVSSDGVKVLYISPLKALGVDIRNNLRAPLTGIENTANRRGGRLRPISVAVRTGDTPQSERARQVRNAPDVLITTPESLYLMLTSKAGTILSDVGTVIIDEVHALAGSKRGTHLALSLERLERITSQPVQRIGLSATVRPIETVAQFLGGDRDVDIVAPPSSKNWDLTVCVPVEDMSDLPTPENGSTIGEATIDDPLGITTPLDGADPSDAGVTESALPQQASIWPFIEQDVFDRIMAARSTLVFVNSRRAAERLTSRLNEIYASRYEPEALSAYRRRDPAQLMKSADVAGAAASIIARAHHGSVSKDERAATEAALKSGDLTCVVATSSLELGIDMGAVDQVIQVESPPSVASGLQRVGRAGHRVGATSTARFYPKHRSDLLSTAVVVEKMQQGFIEELSVPRNPLDVLVQQTVAVTVTGDIHVDEWFDTVRRAYPYRSLDRAVFDSVIDLASGVYPSADFADLKPRITFDRISGMLSARPGAQRVAVTSGGTIPDRGMFGVFLISGGDNGPRRVGELDEEMVYESRVGDVFTLGASSWRIEDITRDQVLVTPAPGHTGRLPFWGGDSPARPAELGRMIGDFIRRVANDESGVDGAYLNANARENLLRFIADQREATGMVPDERTLLVERFTDELGDWRVILHSPYGRSVNAAWALALGARIAAESGYDAQAVAGDDGIVLRLPTMDREPGPELFQFEREEISQIVTEQVGNSALFASRFRECAARALLLPRRNPGKRAPLWQQRQRAEQLLDVARAYPSFPIILETVRECLQDVYDLPALEELMGQLEQRTVRIAEVTVDQPSPFASSLLFTYTGAFMYEGDSPLAEKRAAALSLDPELLAKLLGAVELRELLDQEIIAETQQELQRRAPGWRARSAEELVDVLRIIGPVPLASLGEHAEFADPAALLEQQANHQVMWVRIHGEEHMAVATDAAVLRDGLGVPVPPGVAASPARIDDALDQLVRRFARTHGPFTVQELASAFGIGVSVAGEAVRRTTLVEGRYRVGVDSREYVDRAVLKKLRTRTLAQARSQVEPVGQRSFAAFMPEWHSVAAVGSHPQLSGVDGVYSVCEQLAGVFLPASAWESLIFPLRVAHYQPGFLDELTQGGEILIVCRGLAGAGDPWVALMPTDYAAELLDRPAEEFLPSTTEAALLESLASGGAFLGRDLHAALANYTDEMGVELPRGEASAEAVSAALWSLIEQGRISPDSFAPLRARLRSSTRRSRGSAAHRSRRRPQRGRLRMGRTSFAQQHAIQQAQDPSRELPGRFFLTPAPTADPNARAIAHGEAWLDRYGVVSRGSVLAEEVTGGFALAYKVLRTFEDNGKAVRGYIIDGLGGAQFSTTAVIDRVRAPREPATYLLAAADPANPYGASLDWPGGGYSRAAGAMVIIHDGNLVGYLSRSGKTLRIPDGQGDDAISRINDAYTHAVGLARLTPVVVDKINGAAVWDTEWLARARQSGIAITPRGITLGGRTSAPRGRVGEKEASIRVEHPDLLPPDRPQPRRGRSLGEAMHNAGGARSEHPPRGGAGPFRRRPPRP